MRHRIENRSDQRDRGRTGPASSRRGKKERENQKRPDFYSQFRNATGMPPHQYVIARRVERARQLLGKGDELSLSDIAIRAGFSDQSHFSNQFKRIIGVTPRQFRRSARSD